MIEAMKAKLWVPRAIKNETVAKMEKIIKTEIECLSPEGTRDSYFAEAKYLFKNWIGYMTLFGNRGLPDFAKWVIAEDFAKQFPYHTYEEWAHVFGIPKDHPVIRDAVLDPKVVMSRRLHAKNLYLAQRGTRFWHMWCLSSISVMLLVTAYGAAERQVFPTFFAIFTLVILGVGYTTMLKSFKMEEDKARGMLNLSSKFVD